MICSQHFEKVTTILSGMEEALEIRQSDLIQFRLQPTDKLKEKQQSELFSNWFTVHEFVAAMCQTSKICVVKALNTLTTESVQRASNRWAREMQHYMSEVERLTLKVRRNLKVAKEDMEDIVGSTLWADANIHWRHFCASPLQQCYGHVTFAERQSWQCNGHGNVACLPALTNCTI